MSKQAEISVSSEAARQFVGGQVGREAGGWAGKYILISAPCSTSIIASALIVPRFCASSHYAMANL